MAPSVTAMGRRPRSARNTTAVIVGAGQAGAQAAFTLRESGFAGRIVLLGDEGQPPYQRPPLSKGFLAGTASVERLLLWPAEHYAAHGIELMLHSPVERIDPAAGRVVLRGGARLGYDLLLLATGSRARRLEIPGARAPAVHSLRTLQDAFRLRSNLTAGRRVVVVGGGYVGLEVAAVAATARARVTVVETLPHLLSRVTTPPVSDHFAALHRHHGVDVRCTTEALAFVGGERLDALETTGGRIAADIAIVGVGAEPNVELARTAGLACDNGIVVDAYCRTSDPAIYAAGDCTSHPALGDGERVRLESVQNAVDQASAAARTMAGLPTRYAEVPWFWSNQYECRLQTAGTCIGHDEIVTRGDPATGSFACLYRRGGALIGVDAVNLPREYMQVRRELAATLAARAGGSRADDAAPPARRQRAA
jgi:3-phenylpropionate/trans-cinnamate dioxygenase ferredoxin reductase subunit